MNIPLSKWEKRRARWAAHKVRSAEEQLKTRLGEETGKIFRGEMLKHLKARAALLKDENL